MTRAIICHKYKFIYCPIPKNACTSVKIWILKLYNDKRVKTLTGIPLVKYAHTNSTIKYIPVATINNPKYKDYYKFVIVRNPIDRCLSVYNDKFIQSYKRGDWKNSPWEKIANKCNSKNGISFSQFINCILPNGKQTVYSEVHWKSQYLIGHFATVKYDSIIKMENLADDIDVLYEKLQIPSSYRNISIINPTRHLENSNNLNQLLHTGNYQLKEVLPFSILDKVRREISEKYKQDINYFGYN